MSTNTTSKVILVTGASSGIGEATARLLAGNGHHVVIGARRTGRLEVLATELRAAGGSVEFRSLDVTDLTNVQDFTDYALEKYGRIDVIVNNAGVMPLSPLDALKIDEWNQMIDVNIRGVLHGIAATLPVMKKQGCGQVINISSIGGHQVWPTCAVYSATKYAVIAISEGLRQENTDIRVTVISPGVTTSELAHTISHDETAGFIDKFREVAIPAEAIARAILFAIDQPGDVDVNEIIVRPTASAN
jgi:NADP-dependent 3-hydroxy acid dehydrogenase YdfG